MEAAGRDHDVHTNRTTTHASDILPNYTATADNVASSDVQPRRRTTRTETVSTLENNANFSWLSLVLTSEASSSRLPSYVGSKPIQGKVIIDLTKPEAIDSVVVTVKGLIYCNVYETTTFYSESKVLWRADSDDEATSTTSRIFGLARKSTIAKLGGQHVWPFAFTIPREFEVRKAVASVNKLRSTELMPPTLEGKAGSSSIDYQVVVDVKRRGIFEVDATLPARFVYEPLSKPPGPPSTLRNEAYLAGTAPLGPDGDAEGWRIFPDIEIRGTLFHARQVLVKCSFALATPVAYTRGSVIPCYLTVSSADPQALQLFSNPVAPVVHLRRKLKFRTSTHEMDGGASHDLRGAATKLSDRVPFSIGVWKEAASSDPQMVQQLGDELEETRGCSKRCLYGELSLPSNLVPSFTFGLFEVKYVVEVHAFNVAGFVPSSGSGASALRNNSNSSGDRRLTRLDDVAIVSGFFGEDDAHVDGGGGVGGPRPRAYLPPGYIIARERSRMATTANANANANTRTSAAGRGAPSSSGS